jgi:hypothetical protein
MIFVSLASNQIGLAQRFRLRRENARVVMSHGISSAQPIMTKNISGIERKSDKEKRQSRAWLLCFVAAET